jgi:hypothetical protein
MLTITVTLLKGSENCVDLNRHPRWLLRILSPNTVCPPEQVTTDSDSALHPVFEGAELERWPKGKFSCRKGKGVLTFNHSFSLKILLCRLVANSC